MKRRIFQLIVLSVILGMGACSSAHEKQTQRDPSGQKAGVISISGPVRFQSEEIPYPKLSDYAFFSGEQARLQPNEGVLPYELITPLFTDYAHKARFVWMKEGQQAWVDEEGVIQFPDETVLIKNFYYPADFGHPEARRDVIETRLLVRRSGTWEAFSYVWDKAQSDARLKNTGDIQKVSWTDEQGLAHTIDYVVPNKNQCKSCHHRDNVIQPIGPKVRNLQKAIRYPDGRSQNQLVRWQEAGFLMEGTYREEAMPDWSDPQAGLQDRALAYLEVNCGHCHRPDGSAKTTGMFLNWEEGDPGKWGLCKPPVAAGRGSGGRQFGILPGHPAQSILVHRMESDDPGVMMPELGRVVPHREGIDLIRDWIAELEGDCN